MLSFYFAPGSSSMAPHLALHETGAPFEPRPVSFHSASQRSPEFLALNPEGKVPLLLIDGRPLTEVAGILWYLARRFPGAELAPADNPEAEGHVVAWMSFIASTLHPARRQGPEQLERVWAIAEQRMADREWAIGRYSIADIHLFRLFWRIKGSQPQLADRFANLCAHYQRMMRRPAVIKTCETEAAIGYELPA